MDLLLGFSLAGLAGVLFVVVQSARLNFGRRRAIVRQVARRMRGQ